MKRNFLKKLQIAATGAAMADMALLLLVFFMASTTTEPPKGVEVRLPTAQTEGAEQDSIYLSMSSAGDLYYEGEKINLDELSAKLEQRSLEKDNVVALTIDKEMPYSRVKAVLDVLKEREFLNVVFMAEQVEDRAQ